MNAALKTKLDALRERGVDADLIGRIETLVREAPPAQLAKLSPPRLAEDWGAPAGQVLEAFLHATRAGLFDLEWDVRCPSCTGPTQREAHLDQLQTRASCDICELEFDGSFDRSIEVTWCVHPELRDLSGVDPLEVLQAYFQPVPLLQLSAAAGSSAEAEVELGCGNYHFYVPAAGLVKGLRVNDEGADASEVIELSCDGQRIERGAWQRKEGRCTLRLRNQSADAIELMMVKVTDRPWISGAALASTQSFRDHFAAELIRPDQSFAIRSLAIVFTDLKGSTALYERVGDAVMATFLDTSAALRFALELHTAFDRFNAEQTRRDDVIVKVGIHGGPCIAVTLNERLDYFGRTVNLAARVQGLSEGRDVVLSSELMRDARVQELAERSGWSQQSFTAALKGIDEERALIRLLPRSL